MSIKEFFCKRAQLKTTLEQVNTELKSVLKNPRLKNSKLMIELQIRRLQILDKLRYLRPDNQKDVTYREWVIRNFSEWGLKNIPDDLHLAFHGTTLANTERILNSGRIISGKDRWTIHSSGDQENQVSVSTKDSLLIAVFHMDINAQGGYIPAGSMFVLQVDDNEYQYAQDDSHIHNVQLRKNPNQLYAIITTPENEKRIKWWTEQSGFPSEKVMTFESFQEKIEHLAPRQVSQKKHRSPCQTILKERA